jgi:hypothetical protein
MIINQMQDIIVVENYQSEGDKIKLVEGSKLLCGCCGKQLAVVSGEIAFPFEYADLKPMLNDVSFTVNVLGMRHKTCGHTMFSFKKGFGFIPIEKFIEFQNSKSKTKKNQGMQGRGRKPM